MLLSLMIEEVICHYYSYSHSDSRPVSPSCLSLTGQVRMRLRRSNGVELSIKGSMEKATLQFLST